MRSDRHTNCRKEDLLLYAVTDRSWLNGETLYEQVEKALKGGVRLSWRKQRRSRSFVQSIMCPL